MPRIIFLTLGLALVLSQAFSQYPHFQEYQLLRSREALEIKSLLQDADGYIWIGTNKGLFRFDGINKIQFTPADGLSENFVSALAVDSLGRIWAGHRNGKISYSEGAQFVEFTTDEGSATAEISKIHFDKRGTLWFSTLNDGLYYYRRSRLFRLDETDGMPDVFVYDFAEGEDGTIYAGTDLGLAIIKLDSNKATIESISSKGGLGDNIIRNVAASDAIWLATQDQGLFKLTQDDQRVVEQEFALERSSINDFVIIRNKIWFTADEGLYIYSITDQTTRGIRTESHCNKILQDREGNVWIGTQSGLLRSFGDHIQVIKTGGPDGPDNVVALAIDKTNNLWFSGDQGLYMKTPDAGIQKQLKKTPYENLPIISLYVDDTNNLWAGTYGSGVIKINVADGRLVYFNDDLRSGNVLSVKGRGEEIWLATLAGASQIVSRGNEVTIKNYGRDNGFHSDYNYQVFVDSKMRKWFATDGKWAIVREGDNFLSIVDSARSKVVYGFDEDRNGDIWANFQGDGIYRIRDRQIVRAHNFSTTESISAFVCERGESIVAAHDLGIVVINTSTGEERQFGEEYGIREMKPNLNAVARDAIGNIYFGTDNGIIVLSSELNSYPSRPQVKFEGVTNSNKSVDLSGPLEFSHNQNDLVIHYTAFWYQNPDELFFSYMLENFDNSWVVNQNRFVTYSNLPPGEYVFKVKASTTSDFKSAKGIELSFTIRPPFWKRAWFYFLVAVLIIYFAYWFIRYRERSLVEENHRLEMKVKERFAEILKKNEEIMMQAEEIKTINENLEKIVKQRTEQLERKNKALEEAAFFNSHQLRAPVASLLGLTSLIKRLRLATEDRDYLTHLEDSCQKLDDVIKTITSKIDEANHPGKDE